jgi:DNA-binding MarR family transcriptional regulator
MTTLTVAERNLWRGFLAWSNSLTTDIGRELTAATGLTIPDFEILGRLYETPDGALDQRELSESLTWSASRLSHQLTRMESRGYITRSETGVGRGMRVAFTEVGRNRAAEALDKSAGAVRRQFIEPLTAEDEAALARIMRAHAQRAGSESA